MSLYSDKTFENIQDEALQDLRSRISELPENQQVDASEGSLLYMAIAKQAVRLEEAYQDLDELNDNILADTQDFEHLVDSGAECGVPLQEGTPAVVVAELNCQCEVGDEFSAIDSDYDYIVTGLKESVTVNDETRYRYYLEADEAGIDPGNYRGDIEPQDYLEGFEDGAIIATYVAGTEDEEEDVYRERRISAAQKTPCAGNYAYYHDTIGDIDGVGGVKVERRTTGQAYINCYVQAANYGVPSSSVVDNVKEIMDPSDAEGQGVGLCPFGHKLSVSAVTGVTINVTATFTFDSGYSMSNLNTALVAAAEEYIVEVAKTWEDTSSLVVRRAQIENKFIGVTGVLDVEDLQINGSSSNLSLTAYQVPVMGTVSEASS